MWSEQKVAKGRNENSNEGGSIKLEKVELLLNEEAALPTAFRLIDCKPRISAGFLSRLAKGMNE